MYSPYSKKCLFERQQQNKYERIGSEYKGLDASKWPRLYIEWDLTPENFYRSLDGENMESVSQAYDKGFAIGKVATDSIYKKLFFNCIVKNSNDFWSICNENKACGVLGRWKEQQLITPPLLTPYEGTLIIAGGNHRFNVARLAGAEMIYFITPKESQSEIDSIISSVLWQFG
ncbi:hypothetical protein KXE83_003108 [Escherichia coli]|uniref:hypothetical protein n=1 Tax=Enterobacteriaceae TaxID=543 RepID=UPI000665D51A|nr:MULTISPECIES: hypothetical protein [Enterobacteriaceae]HBQ3104199.1 hypothetical protein [Klebsiella quasipneumoniae subsp. similipneumoniae]EFN4754192.1 hypothetical protein [Escherichia coli]EGY1361426.1 hypothetical protein [Escherichia coli]EHT2469253.1 hypothetical protein [Escherichia coli]EJV7172627.1 hypothetical protein [Escherichia coli]